MIPYALLLTLAGLGTPNISPEKELNVRAAAQYPSGSLSLGLRINPDLSFIWDGEDPAEARRRHRPLKIRKLRLAPTNACLNLMISLAENHAFANRLIGTALIWTTIELCRTHLQDHPGDIFAMVWLGKLNDRVDQREVAERRLRQATRCAPRVWPTWQALAEHYLEHAFSAQFDPAQIPSSGNWSLKGDEIAAAIRRGHAEDSAEIERCRRNAMDCMDWGVIFAPDNALPYLYRYAWRNQIAGFSVVESAKSDTWANNVRKMAADTYKAAELTGHPLLYGLALIHESSSTEFGRSKLSIDRKIRWKQASAHLSNLRHDPDPLIRNDATRVLIMVRCMVFEDFVGARRLLEELSKEPGDQIMISLAAMVYGRLNDQKALAHLLERKLSPVDANDYFILASTRERADDVAGALQAARAGTQKFPNDVRLNLTCTGLLLQYGTAADLLEVHLRLTRLEDYYTRRLTAKDGSCHFPDDWTEEYAALMQLYSLHRAVYLGLIGQTEWRSISPIMRRI